MEAWQQAFAQMKDQFMVKSMQRLEQIDTLIGALDQIPSDLDVMRQVMRHFHWLAGSGGTYDMRPSPMLVDMARNSATTLSTAKLFFRMMTASIAHAR